MKRIIIILAAIFYASFGLYAQDALEQANENYKTGKFNEAIALYEQVLKERGPSAVVYFNLGNSYFRVNRLAPCILNYERSLLLDPGDRDVRFSLEVARLKTVDKIEPVGDFFLSEGFRAVQNLLSADEWSYLGIACFLLFIASLFVYFFSRKIGLKKTGFYVGLVFLVLTVLANIFAWNEKKQLQNRNTAIIFSPTTTIKNSPDASGSDQFILHEGTKVETKRKVGDWTEIETADGNVGWIQSKEIEVI
ncbi:MAG: hypothetical protein LBR64_02950 [Dysgonamonadaceae bacterium]|jgi:tetratricopeptide (TPR) repeat protein|nr:hypothetical protein [Dysgonamonadaceae bacterium]